MRWLFAVLVSALFTSAADAAPDVVRLDSNPIIRPEMLPGPDGQNINGPSLIRVPAWVRKPLGRYYLYFAHHSGRYIRLAYADRLEGPWQIHQPGALWLDDAPGCRDHIASPDIIINEAQQQIRMYFHCLARAARGQKTFAALSADGLAFTANDEILGPFYFRVFRHDNWWYAIAKGGILLRSSDGLTGFERGPDLFASIADQSGPRPRHFAVLPDGDVLWVYYSRIGDAPERILRSQIRLSPGWRQWAITAPVDALRPERNFEGASLPVVPSGSGEARRPENGLRDPGIFVDTDGRRYLLYSVAGESGLAIAELK